MICPYCGAELENDDLFCGECGKKLVESKDSELVKTKDVLTKFENIVHKKVYLVGAIVALVIIVAVIIGISVGTGKKSEVKNAQTTESQAEGKGTDKHSQTEKSNSSASATTFPNSQVLNVDANKTNEEDAKTENKEPCDYMVYLDALDDVYNGENAYRYSLYDIDADGTLELLVEELDTYNNLMIYYCYGIAPNRYYQIHTAGKGIFEMNVGCDTAQRNFYYLEDGSEGLFTEPMNGIAKGASIDDSKEIWLFTLQDGRYKIENKINRYSGKLKVLPFFDIMNVKPLEKAAKGISILTDAADALNLSDSTVSADAMGISYQSYEEILNLEVGEHGLYEKYAVCDLDNDGIHELLISHDAAGGYCYDVFTVINGSAVYLGEFYGVDCLFFADGTITRDGAGIISVSGKMDNENIDQIKKQGTELIIENVLNKEVMPSEEYYENDMPIHLFEIADRRALNEILSGQEKQESNSGSEYILPESSSRRLTADDLKGLDSDKLRIARNEIYARHGRKFNDQELQRYFESKSWYSGVYDADSFQENWLSEIEKYNRDFIKEHEK